MKPRWDVIAIEQRGGRSVYLLEHTRTGDRARIYRRGHHWRYFDAVQGDRHVDDQTMVAAVRRKRAAQAAEKDVQLSLYPESGRRVVRTSAPATREAAPA